MRRHYASRQAAQRYDGNALQTLVDISDAVAAKRARPTSSLLNCKRPWPKRRSGMTGMPYGKLESAIVHLAGNVESSGAKLSAPATLLPLISDFLQWTPFPPKSAKKLAEVSARLCRGFSRLRGDLLFLPIAGFRCAPKSG
jgi:hypothetical protein